MRAMNFDAFLDGMGSIYFWKPSRFDDDKTPQQIDDDVIRADWERVGQNMWRALETYGADVKASRAK